MRIGRHMESTPSPDSAAEADAGLSALIRESWRRSTEAGLRPDDRADGMVAARSELTERLEANARLIAYAQPVIEHLHQQIARSSSMVLLADRDGMVLRAVGDSGFVERASRISLTPGAVWSEQTMGTNAIGTALVEGRSVTVQGTEHYLARNGFLTCIATPILAPTGGVLGILDISSDVRVTHSHARALLNTTVEMIENRLIEGLPDGYLELRFHPSAEMIDSPLGGLALFDEMGQFCCCNRRARALLGLECETPPQPAGSFGQFFLTPWHRLLDHALRHGQQPLRLRTGSGRELAATACLRTSGQGRATRLAPPPAAAPATSGTPPRTLRQTPLPSDTERDLAALDLGDERMHGAIQRALRIAEHDIPLLIQGETGSGKEVFARAFHHSGLRRNGPFVAVNCAAIPASLIEAELFGYVAGAYTGANPHGADGKLRAAHGGTLFLDEIGDMPLSLQAVLLRVVETRRVAPLGGGPEETIDIGLVCASHRPLRELAAAGSFRSDLFFRLSGMTVSLPPLRERSDFAALVHGILAEMAPSAELAIATEALELLRAHPWPGNLRQLRNVLRLAAALMGEGEHRIERQHLPQEILDEIPLSGPGGAPATGLRAIESQVVQDAVRRNRGNISAAARELGITRTTLYRKLRIAGVTPER